VHRAFGEQRQDCGPDVAALATSPSASTRLVTETESETRAEAWTESASKPWPEPAVHERAGSASPSPGLILEVAARIAFVTTTAVAPTWPATCGVETESETKWCVGPKLFGPLVMGSHMYLLVLGGRRSRLSIHNDISESIVMQRKLSETISRAAASYAP
jgi:hypothetical protein